MQCWYWSKSRTKIKTHTNSNSSGDGSGSGSGEGGSSGTGRGEADAEADRGDQVKSEEEKGSNNYVVIDNTGFEAYQKFEKFDGTIIMSNDARSDRYMPKKVFGNVYNSIVGLTRGGTDYLCS